MQMAVPVPMGVNATRATVLTSHVLLCSLGGDGSL